MSNEPMPTYGLDRVFPLLWEDVTTFDFAERLGGCTDPRLAEIDKAMRELWDARRYVREGHPTPPSLERFDRNVRVEWSRCGHFGLYAAGDRRPGFHCPICGLRAAKVEVTPEESRA